MSPSKFVLGFFILTLTACDPFHSLVVSNDSKQDKSIQIVMPDEVYNSFGLRDSLLFESNEKKGNVQTKTVKRPVTKDSLTKSYSFVLPSQQNAIIEFGLGARPIKQKIIIDNTDTVIVKPNSKRIKKKPKLALGGEYKLTIID
jgi:hypothetical protein